MQKRGSHRLPLHEVSYECVPAAKLGQGTLCPSPGTCPHPHADHISLSLLPGNRSDWKKIWQWNWTNLGVSRQGWGAPIPNLQSQHVVEKHPDKSCLSFAFLLILKSNFIFLDLLIIPLFFRSSIFLLLRHHRAPECSCVLLSLVLLAGWYREVSNGHIPAADSPCCCANAISTFFSLCHSWYTAFLLLPFVLGLTFTQTAFAIHYQHPKLHWAWVSPRFPFHAVLEEADICLEHNLHALQHAEISSAPVLGP